MNELEKTLRDLPKAYYPDKPEVPVPSQLNNTQLTGKYFDPGYGLLNIVEAHIDGNNALFANRTELLTPHEIRFGHVSGNYWLAEVFATDQQMVAGVWAAEFKPGVDGEATGLEITLAPPGEEIDEGTVWFKKID